MKKIILFLILSFGLYQGVFATQFFMGTDWGTGSSVFTMPQSQKIQEISFGMKFGDPILLIMSFGLLMGMLGISIGFNQDQVRRDEKTERKQNQAKSQEYRQSVVATNRAQNRRKI